MIEQTTEIHSNTYPKRMSEYFKKSYDKKYTTKILELYSETIYSRNSSPTVSVLFYNHSINILTYWTEVKCLC